MTGLQPEDFGDDGIETGENEIVVPVANPGGLEQQRGATQGPGGAGVLPFVADDEAAFEVEMPLKGGLGEQARLGFAAWAFIGFVVGTDQNVVERKALAELVMHAIEFTTGKSAMGHGGLVGSGDQKEARRLELLQQGDGDVVDLELFQRERGGLVLALDDCPVQDAVPLDKYPDLHACEKA